MTATVTVPVCSAAPTWLLSMSLGLNFILLILLVLSWAPTASIVNNTRFDISKIRNFFSCVFAGPVKEQIQPEESATRIDWQWTWDHESNEKVPGKAIKRFSNHGSVLSYAPAPVQGVFSRTWYVFFEDGFQAVVQRRSEKLFDIRWKQAKAILGDLVPSIDRAFKHEEHGTRSFRFWVVMNRMKGTTWYERQENPSWTVEREARAFGNLGNIFSRCFVPGSGWDLLDDFYIPQLKKLAESDSQEFASAKGHFNRLIKSIAMNLEGLKALPAQLAHFDINGQNIMVDAEGNVTGLLDWDAPGRNLQKTTTPQVFGIICGALPFLGCRIVNNRWVKREDCQTMEQIFWEAVMKGAPNPTRAALRQNWAAVRVSVQLGVVFSICFLGRLKKWVATLDNIDEVLREIVAVDIDKYFRLTEPRPEEP